MSRLLNISEAASLGLHTAVLLAARPDRLVSTSEIATSLHASEAHLAKVLQRLAKAGLVKSSRGPSGGFALARPGEEISLLEVYEAIEGPLGQTCCLLGKPICGVKGCILGGMMTNLNNEVREYLTKTKVSEMTDRFEEGGRDAA